MCGPTDAAQQMLAKERFVISLGRMTHAGVPGAAAVKRKIPVGARETAIGAALQEGVFANAKDNKIAYAVIVDIDRV